MMRRVRQLSVEPLSWCLPMLWRHSSTGRPISSFIDLGAPENKNFVKFLESLNIDFSQAPADLPDHIKVSTLKGFPQHYEALFGKQETRFIEPCEFVSARLNNKDDWLPTQILVGAAEQRYADILLAISSLRNAQSSPKSGLVCGTFMRGGGKTTMAKAIVARGLKEDAMRGRVIAFESSKFTHPDNKVAEEDVGNFIIDQIRQHLEYIQKKSLTSEVPEKVTTNCTAIKDRVAAYIDIWDSYTQKVYGKSGETTDWLPPVIVMDTCEEFAMTEVTDHTHHQSQRKYNALESFAFLLPPKHVLVAFGTLAHLFKGEGRKIYATHVNVVDIQPCELLKPRDINEALYRWSGGSEKDIPEDEMISEVFVRIYHALTCGLPRALRHLLFGVEIKICHRDVVLRKKVSKVIEASFERLPDMYFLSSSDGEMIIALLAATRFPLMPTATVSPTPSVAINRACLLEGEECHLDQSNGLVMTPLACLYTREKGNEHFIVPLRNGGNRVNLLELCPVINLDVLRWFLKAATWSWGRELNGTWVRCCTSDTCFAAGRGLKKMGGWRLRMCWRRLKDLPVCVTTLSWRRKLS